MMKKYIPFAEYNIRSMRNGSVLSLHFCDGFIGCLEQEVTSQIIHTAWYFTYVSYVLGQGCGSLRAVILLASSLEISCCTAESCGSPDLLMLHLRSVLFRYGLISRAASPETSVFWCVRLHRATKWFQTCGWCCSLGDFRDLIHSE